MTDFGLSVNEAGKLVDAKVYELQIVALRNASDEIVYDISSMNEVMDSHSALLSLKNNKGLEIDRESIKAIIAEHLSPVKGVEVKNHSYSTLDNIFGTARSAVAAAERDAAYMNAVERGDTAEQERIIMERAEEALKLDCFVGMIPWLLFDFRCPRRLHWIQDHYNTKGLVAADRKHRKLAFYAMQTFYAELANKSIMYTPQH